MSWLFGLDKPAKTTKKKAAPKKPPFSHQAQLTAIQKRKKELEKELAVLIVQEQQLLKMKGGAK